ncbi:hypothetical protein ACRALDRAFT_1071049 [Sodiomyces alcalophilus JCM 7366]|uniref:uncharacterized protein n=1 Tax=Sodiomyces alcalophilus JCM 7366 TaxID=591952 RepID=UPI0039B684E8
MKTASAEATYMQPTKHTRPEGLQTSISEATWCDNSSRLAVQAIETNSELDISTTTVSILQTITVTAEVTVVSPSPTPVWKTITTHATPDTQEGVIPGHLGESGTLQGDEEFTLGASETPVKEPSGNPNAVAIVGGVLGSLVAVLLVGLVVLAVRKRRPKIQFLEAR